MLHLVEDDADTPAHYGAQAAILADALGATLQHLAARFDEDRFPDAVQHVTRDGALVPSGLIWSERLSGQPVTAARSAEDLIANAAANAPVIVPVHPGTEGGLARLDALAALAARSHVATARYRVMRAHGLVETVELEQAGSTGGLPRIVTRAQQDRFGRWTWSAPHAQRGPAAALPATDARKRTASASVHIALIGREADQRDTYPATLAALADAADAQAIDVTIGFVSPHDLDDANAEEALRAFDGIVLPGGADMTRVPGQIAAAAYAWRASRPVVGLCLGMQSMATAIARLAMHTNDVGLMEAQPDARILSFVPIGADRSAAPVHRLGRHPLDVAPSSRLNAILGERQWIHCNHRYRLNPELDVPLSSVGVEIVARDASGRIADAIEARDHPFFIGMQGHPELSSASGAPHPLLSAFLRAAADRA